MVTLFTIPRAFTGLAAVHQWNALHSWARLAPYCEVFVCGDEAGVGEATHKVGARHLATMERTEYGTPLLQSAFRQVAEHATFDRICYLNADIMLLDDFLEAVGRLPTVAFLASARRWDVPVDAPVDLQVPAWQTALREQIAREGVLHPTCAMDLFLLAKDGPLAELPPFAVGRPAWDNWMVFRARQCGLPVIDMTPSVTLVHQRHDYRHVPQGRRGSWEGPEADRNRALLGSRLRVFTLDDATHMLTPEGLQARSGFRYRVRRVWRWPAFVPPLCWCLDALLTPVAAARRWLVSRREGRSRS